MTAKIVYYGPGLSGKTTSIQYIHQKINPSNKGKLVSLATETDRTLFFDFFPVDFGKIGGFRVKFNFYTVPGQVFYNTTRKLVLKGADGVVFVADSQQGMEEQNDESLQNLYENLRVHGFDPDTIPFVIQYNKCDMPNIMSPEVLRAALNHRGVPDFETSATVGTGIMEAMRAICKLVLEDLRTKQQKSQGGAAAVKAEAAEQAKVQAEQAKAAEAQAAVAQVPDQEEAVEAAPAAGAAPVGGPVTEERTLDITVAKPKKGKAERTITLPLTIDVGEGVDHANVKVKVDVSYDSGQGKVSLGQIEQEAPKKGFFAKLFGG